MEPASNVAQQPSLAHVDAFLEQLIAELEPDPSAKARGRPRVLPSMCMWAALLWCVLHGFSSQRAIWRLVAVKGLWQYPRFPISDQALYNRLEREGTGALERLFVRLTELLFGRLASMMGSDKLCPFATQVYVLDETTLDKMKRKIKWLRDQPASKLLAGVFTGLFDVRMQLWRRIKYRTETTANEKRFAREMIEDLPVGSLLIADLGYFSFKWFDDLSERGYYWLSRLRKGTSYTIKHIYYQSESFLDAVVMLGAYRADSSAHAVRVIRFRRGNLWHGYVTNVLDPKLFPAIDVVRTYARRWDIEMAFNLIKTQLGLHLIWSTKSVVIQIQLWAVIILSQILSALRYEIALKAGVDLFEVSMALMIQWMPLIAEKGEDPVEVLIRYGRQGGFIRPSQRIQIELPEVGQYTPLPPGLHLRRKPRYAKRKCGPRTK